MTDTAKPALPDRLAGNPRSPFFIKECFDHQIGIRFNGKERTDVEEYCVSEGWVEPPTLALLQPFLQQEPTDRLLHDSN